MEREENHQQQKEPNCFLPSERRSSPPEDPEASMGLQEGSCRPISAQSNSGGSAGNHRSSFFRHLHPAQSSLSNGGPTSSAYDPAFSSHSTSSPSQVFHHPLPHETYHSLHSPYPSHHLTARGTINVHAFGRHTFPPPPPTSVSHYYRSITRSLYH